MAGAGGARTVVHHYPETRMRLMPIRLASTLAATPPLCLALAACAMDSPVGQADPLVEAIVFTTAAPAEHGHLPLR